MKKMTYGQWLVNKRMELDFTQADVEQRLGMGSSTMSKYEHDDRRPTAETRSEIHRLFGTSDKELAELGILEEYGDSGRYGWPRGIRTSESPSVQVTRAEAIRQIRDAAGDMVWTQAMVDAIVQQVKTFRSLQGGTE